MNSEDDFLERRIIFFDGYCNLCNGSVDFVAKRNKKKLLFFAPIQSDLGRRLLGLNHDESNSPNSILFWDEGKVHKESEAILGIVRYMDALYPVFTVFRIIPIFIRDWVYKFIAKNRFRWFGKRNTCRLPTEEEKSMFVS